jgi:hypothetical protein
MDSFPTVSLHRDAARPAERPAGELRALKKRGGSHAGFTVDVADALMQLSAQYDRVHLDQKPCPKKRGFLHPQRMKTMRRKRVCGIEHAGFDP